MGLSHEPQACGPPAPHLRVCPSPHHPQTYRLLKGHGDPSPLPLVGIRLPLLPTRVPRLWQARLCSGLALFSMQRSRWLS